MMKEIKLGDYNTLKIKELARREGYGEVFGLYLDGGREGEILMPQKYVPEGVKPGDEIECFIYLDQEERPIATTEKPLAKVGDFACLECSWVNEYGAFLNWGLTKEVFCPFHEQKKRMEIGESYIVYIHIDEESYRIVASAKVDKFLSKEIPPYKVGDSVDILIQQKTDLGFKAIVEGKYSGLIYQSELFQNIHTGDRLQAYVKNVRPDGKIDLVLQQHGRRHVRSFSDQLYEYIMQHDGFCPYHDKSPAEDIYEVFQVSKKTFKQAVGDLYKKHKIELLSDGLKATTNNEE